MKKIIYSLILLALLASSSFAQSKNLQANQVEFTKKSSYPVRANIGKFIMYANPSTNKMEYVDENGVVQTLSTSSGHTQNTDTGTTSTTWIINSGGNSGIISTDSLTGDRTFLLPDHTGSTLLTTASSTSNLPEGTNLYYTDDRVNSLLTSPGSIGSIVPGAGYFDFLVGNNVYADLSLNTEITYFHYQGSEPGTPPNSYSVLWADATGYHRKAAVTGTIYDIVDTSNFGVSFSTKSTSDLVEGSNLYYTTARFDTALATKSTDNLSEGSTNKYYSTSLARADFSATSPILYSSGVFSLAGLTALGTGNQLVGMNSGATSYEYKSIVAGTNIAINHTANQIEIVGTASGAAISALTAAAGTNSINNADFAQTWSWDTLSSNTGLLLSSSSTAAASNTQKILAIALSGANSTTTQTTYGSYITNVHTGTLSTNVAGYWSASGGTNNYAALFAAGNVGIGTTAPANLLEIRGTQNSTLTNFTQNVSTHAISVSTTSSLGAYNPGLIWYSHDSNPTKPYAGIWSRKESGGSSIYMGTSNSYTTGISNSGFQLDSLGNVIILLSMSAPTVTASTGVTTGLVATSGQLEFRANSLANNFLLSALGKASFISSAAGSGVQNAFKVTSPADNNLTASTNVPMVKFDISATSTHANGAITEQNFFEITQPTINGTSGSSTVITDLSNLTVYGAPGVGANASATRSMAVWVKGGSSRFDGGIWIRNVSNGRQGTATLSGGTVTVNTTAVTATSLIYLTSRGDGTFANIGVPTRGTITAGTSFVINSSNVLDNSQVDWIIIEGA
jgi:hypothetical protein